MGVIALTAPAAFAGLPESYPWQPNPHYQEAQQLLKARKWPEAAIVLRSVQQRAGEAASLRVSLDLVRALTFSGRREEALSVLAQLLSRERKGARRDLLIRRVQVLSRQFLTNESFQLYQDGLNLLAAGRYRQARVRLEAAAAREPDNIEILIRLGQSLLLDQDEDSAAERLKLARKLNAFEPEMNLWLGRAMYLRGELQEALSALRLAFEQLESSELAPLWYAEALAGAGQRGLAFEILETDLQEAPLHLEGLLGLVRLRLESPGRDAQGSLWAARKDLQLASSRLAAYVDPRRPRFEGELGLDSQRSNDEMKAYVEKLQAQVEGQLEKLRGSSALD
ncbi:MAG: hypothetical protein NDJ90_03540 [Oligoflexia bacterium]|nr:hypothetical protein [Oligoflexia bacterium]